MSELWITHPLLTPGHDIKILRQALGGYVGSGWQVREDQSDPVEVFVPADPRPPAPVLPVVDVPADPRLIEATPEAPALSGTSKTPSPAPRTKES